MKIIVNSNRSNNTSLLKLHDTSEEMTGGTLLKAAADADSDTAIIRKLCFIVLHRTWQESASTEYVLKIDGPHNS